jgi:hypothetical protein
VPREGQTEFRRQGCESNYRSENADPSKLAKEPTSIADDCILVDAIASAARTRLSANTALTTPMTKNPLSVARC